jgi:hypothetical protein
MNDLLHSFPGQEANEPVYVFARSYPIGMIPTFLIYAIVEIVSLIGQILIRGVDFSQSFPNLGNYMIMGIGIFQLLALIIFLIEVMDFYFDIVIVSDRRFVDIEQEQLFYRKISELSLEDVEDVSSVINGFFPTFFNYGTVQVQTAGEKEMFIMHNVRYPREITAITLNLSEQAKKKRLSQERFPETEVIGVINSTRLYTAQDLKNAGAILPADMRYYNRQKHGANWTGNPDDQPAAATNSDPNPAKNPDTPYPSQNTSYTYGSQDPTPPPWQMAPQPQTTIPWQTPAEAQTQSQPETQPENQPQPLTPQTPPKNTPNPDETTRF